MTPMRFACCVAFLVVALFLPAHAGEPFPFGSELMLDAAPMPGSKRVPMLEIDDDGAVAIDLWCASLRGRVMIGDDSITILPGQMQSTQCEPQRQAADAALLAAITEITRWRRAGDVVELSGPTTLRFRLMTN